MKKALKIIGIVIAVLIIVLVLTPILFKGQIESAVKNSINENVEAKVEWKDLSLSLFSSFPDAQLTLNDIEVINKAPFEGDTLVSGEAIALDIGIMPLISGDEPLSINDLNIKNALINVKVNEDGKANYDIAKESPDDEEEEAPATDEGGGMTLNIQQYAIENSRINYLDESSKMYLMLKKFNHDGTGDFTEDIFDLSTHTDAVVSFEMDDTNYLKDNSIELDADLKMDLEQMKFSFLDNKAMVNNLPLEFDGYLQMIETGQEMDINFSTPNSDFKNLLGLVPEKYAQNLEGVETSGEFNLDGRIYGTVDDTHIPKMNIELKSQNASFQYPDLPKTVKNIQLDASLANASGKMEDFLVNLKQLHFAIDRDQFGGTAKVKDLMGNMKVDMTAKGQLDLANLEKAYPLELDTDLTGRLNADIAANFDMNSIENEKYQNVKTEGNAELQNFVYKGDQLPHSFKIEDAALNFNTKKVQLKRFKAATGKSDLNVNGSLENFIGFAVSDQNLKGRFNISSKYVAVSDLMPKGSGEEADEDKEEDDKSAETENGAPSEDINIPDFLDVNIDFKADEILYDNLTLKNASGALAIRDQKAELKRISADIFGGTIGLDGSVSTKSKKPNFDMKLDLKHIGIAESVRDMDLISSLAPIVQALQGNLNTSINLKGDLTSSLTPIFESLDGSALAEILDANIQSDKLPLMSKLDGKMDFLNLDKLDLSNLKTAFSFEDGKIKVKPFNFNIKDFKIEGDGFHRLDQSMDYNLNLKLPAKYLGDQISGKLASLTGSDLKNTTVDLPVNLSGTFQSPKVKLEMKSAIQNLTKKIVDEQKQNAKDKVKDKIGDFLNGKKGDEKKGDEAQKEGDNKKDKDGEKSDKDKVKDALKGIFGKDKDKDDSKKGNDKKDK